MLKKIFIGATTSLIILSVGNCANAYDYQELSKIDQKQVKKQGVYYSLGVATSKNDIKIYRHCEDTKNLKKKDRYIINVYGGHFKKGQKYKIKYYGDYIANVKKL